jgi:lysophospholipase L1-like esterase
MNTFKEVYMLKIFETKNKKEFDKVMESLNEWGAKVYDAAYQEYSQMAKEENENVFKIFDDWWHGKCVTTDEYMSQYSQQDNKRAGDVILTAISSGFG